MPSKKLFTPVAMVILGCADAATGGVEVPEFAGTLPSPAAVGVERVNVPAETTDVTGVQQAGGASTGDSPLDGQQSSNEGQNPAEVPLEGAGGAGVVGGQSSQETAAGAGGSESPIEPETEQPPEPEPVVFPPLDCSAPRPTLSGGTQACRVNASGSVDGQSWFMWYSGSNGCMTPFDGLGGAFRATWNNSGDFLARMGLQWDETQTFDQLGTIAADLAFSRSGSAGGYSFIGIYGWSNDPLVEYYIVEDSFGNGPATPFATTQRGTFDVDGATYRIYSGTKTNQPSIHGTATFQQIFSVRQSPRQCGHVSITEHFRQWQRMGMNLGKMYEARVLVEAGGGSGSIDFTRARVTAGQD
jgi:hypothetical protein